MMKKLEEKGMFYLECEVRDPKNLREGEVIAIVLDHLGAREQIQVERQFLIQRSGRYFLPVWDLSQDREHKLVEIELPQESASGTNRMWVKNDHLFFQKDEVKA